MTPATPAAPGTAGGAQEAAAPGQAAYEAYRLKLFELAGVGEASQKPSRWGGMKPNERGSWEAAAEAAIDASGWPKCPDGCGCRLGVTGPDGENDADACDCACDGPCCMECRENGYPDAPSYRDLAVKHVMDDLAEAREIIEALREDRQGLDRAERYRAALERVLRVLRGQGIEVMDDAELADVIAKTLEATP